MLQPNLKKILQQLKAFNDPKFCSTVRWRESIINISKMGVGNFIEIGPGK